MYACYCLSKTYKHLQSLAQERTYELHDNIFLCVQVIRNVLHMSDVLKFLTFPYQKNPLQP